MHVHDDHNAQVIVRTEEGGEHTDDGKTGESSFDDLAEQEQFSDQT